ncbi:hypothetical protein THAOC_10162, partial [Thalassiosira oceanica]
CPSAGEFRFFTHEISAPSRRIQGILLQARRAPDRSAVRRRRRDLPSRAAQDGVRAERAGIGQGRFRLARDCCPELG